jgi:hypothetical protein
MNQPSQPSALPPQSEPVTKKGRAIGRIVSWVLSVVGFVILTALFLGPLALTQVRQELNSVRPPSPKAEMQNLVLGRVLEMVFYSIEDAS